MYTNDEIDAKLIERIRNHLLKPKEPGDGRRLQASDLASLWWGSRFCLPQPYVPPSHPPQPQTPSYIPTEAGRREKGLRKVEQSRADKELGYEGDKEEDLLSLPKPKLQTARQREKAGLWKLVGVGGDKELKEVVRKRPQSLTPSDLGVVNESMNRKHAPLEDGGLVWWKKPNLQIVGRTDSFEEVDGELFPVEEKVTDNGNLWFAASNQIQIYCWMFGYPYGFVKMTSPKTGQVKLTKVLVGEGIPVMLERIRQVFVETEWIKGE